MDHCTGEGRGPKGLFCAPALHLLYSILNMVCSQGQERGDQELGNSPVISFYPCSLRGGAEWHRTPLSPCKGAGTRGFRIPACPPACPPCAVFLWKEGWENWEEANGLPNTEQELKTVLWEGDWTDDGLEDRGSVLVPPCPSARLQQPRGPRAVAQAQHEHSWKGAEGAGARHLPAEQGGCWLWRSPLAIRRQHPAHSCDCLVARGAETPKLHGSGGGYSGTSWRGSPSPPGDQAQAVSSGEEADP